MKQVLDYVITMSPSLEASYGSPSLMIPSMTDAGFATCPQLNCPGLSSSLHAASTQARSEQLPLQNTVSLHPFRLHSYCYFFMEPPCALAHSLPRKHQLLSKPSTFITLSERWPPSAYLTKN